MDREDREHFKTTASRLAERSSGSSKTQSSSGLDQHSCQTTARAICGCYRRDEAHDPETFAAALALVLMEYPAELVRLAGDPRTGIVQAFPMGLPNIGQIKQFLDDKLAWRDRMEHLAALPKPEFKRLPKPAPGPGAFANALVRSNLPLYARFMEKAKTADPREFQIVPEGIRVALGWFDQPAQVAKHFSVPTSEDLLDFYPPRPKPEEAA